MAKRASSSSECSSEYDDKASIASSEPDSVTDHKPSTSRIQAKHKSKKARTASLKKAGSPREAPRPWTPTENEIFYDLMGKLVKSKMWEVVKDDGRLGYRGNPGIQAHVKAAMNRLKAKK